MNSLPVIFIKPVSLRSAKVPHLSRRIQPVRHVGPRSDHRDGIGSTSRTVYLWHCQAVPVAEQGGSPNIRVGNAAAASSLACPPDRDCARVARRGRARRCTATRKAKLPSACGQWTLSLTLRSDSFVDFPTPNRQRLEILHVRFGGAEECHIPQLHRSRWEHAAGGGPINDQEMHAQQHAPVEVIHRHSALRSSSRAAASVRSTSRQLPPGVMGWSAAPRLMSCS